MSTRVAKLIIGDAKALQAWARGYVEFFELAQHIHTAHPAYGIQVKGVDGV
jgi:hypothetical protein